MKKFNIVLLLMAVFFVFISCDDDKKPTDPVDNPNTFKASVSGEINLSFEASAIVYTLTKKNESQEDIILTGTQTGAEVDNTISIKIVKLGNNNSFSSAEANLQISYIHYQKKTNTSTYYNVNVNGNASFELLTTDKAKGSFSFTATTENHSKQISVTGGIVDFDRAKIKD